MSDLSINALFVYGTLAPNCANHHIMTPIPNGEWQAAYAFGKLLPNGFGKATGYPAFIPNDKNGERIDGFIFTSPELQNHWDRLDEFEGGGYDRIIIRAYLENGESVRVFVYALAQSEMNAFQKSTFDDTK